MCVERQQIHQLFIQFMYSSVADRHAPYQHHITTQNTPIHNILSTAPQLSIPKKERSLNMAM
jgi:hypothetical protein